MVNTRISVTARTAEQVAETGDGEMWLMKITHPDLPEPVRIATYPAQELTRNPATFGARSTWDGQDTATEPLVYEFVALDFIPPGDQAGVPHAAQLALMIVDDKIDKALRSFTDYARCDIAGVMVSGPSHVECDYWGMVMVDTDIQTAQVILNIGRVPTDQRRSIVGRFTADRAPGLFG